MFAGVRRSLCSLQPPTWWWSSSVTARKREPEPRVAKSPAAELQLQALLLQQLLVLLLQQLPALQLQPQQALLVSRRNLGFSLFCLSHQHSFIHSDTIMSIAMSYTIKYGRVSGLKGKNRRINVFQILKDTKYRSDWIFLYYIFRNKIQNMF